MKTMKKLILLGLFLCAVMSAPAVANINLPPGQDNTYQEWTFSSKPSSWTDIEADAGWQNSSPPTADVALVGPIRPLPGWYLQGDTSGHTGFIYGKDVTVDLEIPNAIEPPPWEKIIQVEVTYHVNTYEQGVHGYIDAASYVAAGGKSYDSVSVNDTELQGGWRDVTITWSGIPQIYPVELIHLYFVDSGVAIDKIVVGTVCVPEPATLLLLGGAAFVGWLRRRRA